MVPNSPGAIEASVSGSYVTSQSLGGVALRVTFVIGAVPVFVIVNCCVVTLPAGPRAESTPVCVVRFIE